MPRCRRKRMVDFIPNNRYFSPFITNNIIEEVILTIDELEAIRLSDVDGLDQSKCAEKMEVSRTTLQRTLNSARNKIADALVNGKPIKIEGGDFMFRGNGQNQVGRGQGGIGRGLASNTTGRCIVNPDMPAGFRRNFSNANTGDQSMQNYAKDLKAEYDRVMKELEK